MLLSSWTAGISTTHSKGTACSGDAAVKDFEFACFSVGVCVVHNTDVPVVAARKNAFGMDASSSLHRCRSRSYYLQCCEGGWCRFFPAVILRSVVVLSFALLLG